ncbi:MAG: hypothetical protein DMG67_01455 [Acidobacteria bacterium]|nr:MAG: hypothetical protein DMG67_01455 [Acidobacteriota bacterium]
MSLTNNLPQISSASGIKFFTMAFIIDGGGCTPVWGGIGPISSESTFAGFISNLRSAGGDVVISFGGAAGSELAQVCSSVSSLQAAYQAVINKYNVKMLDFDIEGAAVGDQTSIDRRSQALANLAAANSGLKISLTLPVNPTGLDNNGVGVDGYGLRRGRYPHGNRCQLRGIEHHESVAIRRPERKSPHHSHDRAERHGRRDLYPDRRADGVELRAIQQQNYTAELLVGLARQRRLRRQYECLRYLQRHLAK